MTELLAVNSGRLAKPCLVRIAKTLPRGRFSSTIPDPGVTVAARRRGRVHLSWTVEVGATAVLGL
ncbi:hypothetical protein [Methylobacterium oryzisoli]|uniref:hypothetical protein n=1 Tax=Methylobacterium oryzisoli TaxID=3385502 RepID=UPI003892A8D6